MANKLLGQHFLNDPSGKVIKSIIDALAPGRGETIVEVGAGHGELTLPLAAACEKIGARLVAIEKDAALATALVKQFSERPGSPVEIISGDALEILASCDRSSKNLKIVGNIPYYLTGHLLRAVSELPADGQPICCVFMVQKEVAERIVAAPPKMNRLAASVQFWAEPKILSVVPKSNFSPPPDVDSAIIVLEAKKSGGWHGTAPHDIKPDHYYAALRALFAQPRKTIANNLASHGGKERVIVLLRTIPIDPGIRPQNLSVEAITAIAETFWGNGDNRP